MVKSKFYITTPIYYVNDKPHIGHAYTTVAADVLARYHRDILKDDTYFLTGTDEHGAKIAEAAKKAGKKPQEFVDTLVPMFEKAWKALDIKYDGFIRTTDPKHEKVVVSLVEKLKENGYVEKRKYEGLYCVGCERFYTEGELIEEKCPDHKTKCVEHSEENYFFALSKAVKDKNLEKLIKNNEIKVAPESRKNEVLGKIKAGLEDVSISRENVQWGIKFPGDDTQTIYVWVDALINYYSATKIFKNGPSWPADLHLMAKDILWFHAIIWPAMLLAAGEKPPKEVYAHGFFTIDGQKMSKTVGNVIDPIEVADKYGADAVRYALLREFPFGEDGDISEEKIAQRYVNDLANELGNLTQRTITMINKYDVKVSVKKDSRCLNKDCTEKFLSDLEFDKALEKLWGCIRKNNKYIEEEKPWELAKSDPAKLAEVLGKLYTFLSSFAEKIYPFMPETSEKMKKQLKDLKPEPLFPRLEE